MNQYSDEVLDHYANPRNVGMLPGANLDVGSGELGNPRQGHLMRLQIRVSSAGKIEDARFKTYGCGCAIAASSLLTELLVGKNLEEAFCMDEMLLADLLKLAPEKQYCSVLAIDVLKQAIGDYQRKQIKARKLARAES